MESTFLSDESLSQGLSRYFPEIFFSSHDQDVLKFPFHFYNASYSSSVSSIYTVLRPRTTKVHVYTMANEESISVHFSSIDYLHKKRRPHDLARRVGGKTTTSFER